MDNTLCCVAFELAHNQWTIHCVVCAAAHIRQSSNQHNMHSLKTVYNFADLVFRIDKCKYKFCRDRTCNYYKLLTLSPILFL